MIEMALKAHGRDDSRARLPHMKRILAIFALPFLLAAVTGFAAPTVILDKDDPAVACHEHDGIETCCDAKVCCHNNPTGNSYYCVLKLARPTIPGSP